MGEITKLLDIYDEAIHLGIYFKKGSALHDITSQAMLIYKTKEDPKHYRMVEKFAGLGSNYYYREPRCKPDYILRALDSNETKVDKEQKHPLDMLAGYFPGVTRRKNIVYKPELLEKIEETPKLHMLGGIQNRSNAIGGKYLCHLKKSGEIRILVIDNISTTGTTAREIGRAIKKSCPKAKLGFFALLKTYNQKSSNIDWYLDERGFGYYLVIKGNEGTNNVVGALLRTHEISFGNNRRCQHPADNGEEYDWFFHLGAHNSSKPDRSKEKKELQNKLTELFDPKTANKSSNEWFYSIFGNLN